MDNKESNGNMEVSLKNIINARKRIKEVVKKTPLMKSKRLSKLYNAEVYLKREDLQEVRSYKIRGAYNLISSLSKKEKEQGVVCASAGNHAQGVAFSCNKLKIKGVIFLPDVTPKQKINKIRGFGGDFVELKIQGNDFDEAQKAAMEYCKKNNMVFVHPFDDPRTINGQATIGLEIYEAMEDVDYIFCPIGGGGLISGISSYIKEVKPETKIIGVEPKGAPSMYESIKKGHVVSLKKIDTFVDGCAVKKIGEKTFSIVSKKVDDIILVPEGKVASEMIELYQNEGIITEPAGALSIAALSEINIKNKKVVCIVSGGNNDLSRYPEIVEKSLVYKGLKHYFIINFAQKPGQLKKFVNFVLGPNDDIVRFEYIKKTNKERGPALVGIELADKNDLNNIIKKLNKYEFDYKIIKTSDILYGFLI